MSGPTCPSCGTTFTNPSNAIAFSLGRHICYNIAKAEEKGNEEKSRVSAVIARALAAGPVPSPVAGSDTPPLYRAVAAAPQPRQPGPPIVHVAAAPQPPMPPAEPRRSAFRNFRPPALNPPVDPAPAPFAPQFPGHVAPMPAHPLPPIPVNPAPLPDTVVARAPAYMPGGTRLPPLPRRGQ